MPELLTLSIGMSLIFTLSQLTSFVARIIFKLIFSSEEYGIFAFFINIYQFFVLLNGLSLHVPLIAAISSRPSNEEYYKNTAGQMFTTSFILGSIYSVFFFIWTTLATSRWDIALIFSFMIIVYSTIAVQHCFPRGRDQLRPVALSHVIVAISRTFLLIMFVFISSNNFTLAVLIYMLPLLGWWISFVYYEGFPSFGRPEIKRILPIYSAGLISYLLPLSLQIPKVLGIVFLTEFYGFGIAGDFDIASIPFSALIAISAGIPFVTINKARKLPEIHKMLRKTLLVVVLPLILASIATVSIAFWIENLAKDILVSLGFPDVIYWPAIILITFAIPIRIVLSTLTSYFQGRGIIKPIGFIAIASAIGMIPVQLLLTISNSIEGVSISLGLIPLVTIVFLLFYIVKYHDSSPTMSNKDDTGQEPVE